MRVARLHLLVMLTLTSSACVDLDVPTACSIDPSVCTNADSSTGDSTLDASSDTRVADTLEVGDTEAPGDVVESGPDTSLTPDTADGSIADTTDALTAVTPHPIAPQSMSTVTSRRPVLRWKLPAGADGAHVDLCSDKACTSSIATFDAIGTTATPTSDLPMGVVYWRLRARSGGVTATDQGPTWEMYVGPRTASVYVFSGLVGPRRSPEGSAHA